MAKTKKPKIAIISLTSCEGCQFALFDQGNKFFDLLKRVDVDEFRLIEDEKMQEDCYDICFIEGNPVTKENVKLLKKMRKISKLLIVLGNCAALGGVWELKNYASKTKAIKRVYKKLKVENPDIKEVDNFVKVDFTLPGCPVTAPEVLWAIEVLLDGRHPMIAQSPVCYECQINGYECLLQKGEVCLGPITLAGCEAVCLKSKQACWGCRGLFDGAKVENFMNYLKSKFPPTQINRAMEVFGARDTIMKELSRQQEERK